MQDISYSSNNRIVLGDDYVAPENKSGDETAAQTEQRGLFTLKKSPLARKIITFNLIALNILAAGLLFLGSSRDTLSKQRTDALMREVQLIASAIEMRLPENAPANLASGDGIDLPDTLTRLHLQTGYDVIVFDDTGAMIAAKTGTLPPIEAPQQDKTQSTPLVDALSWVWSHLPKVSSKTETLGGQALNDLAHQLFDDALNGTIQAKAGTLQHGSSVLTTAAPILQDASPVGVVALASRGEQLDGAIRAERERVLQVFLVATLVSIGLSLILASTIANPISDLAEAAELGERPNQRKSNKGRVRIPDLSGRPDEIGRLSGALRGMVSALYDRIDANEQFAADVAHEIKNPLASLRSAVGSMHLVKKEEQRQKLLEVIDHDVRRLDRLVSDISNASRLDSELVKEEEDAFDLIKMVGNLCDYLGEQAKGHGIDFITDLPPGEVVINGLEPRLAQVFVNLITNAISFCEDGDAIRVWARRRENRVLVVVEDTGPGIPEEALENIFKRFYSERPEGQFGNNSGLGLAISKQIIEAHRGVIWAENIRPTDADITSEPLGARFVVGLPV